MGKVKDEIITYLKKNKYCVLCTCSKDASRATPVRCWNDGVTIVIYSEKYTAKFKNLKKNRQVSIAMHGSRPPLKGLQLWGEARVLSQGDPQHEQYLPAQVKKNPKIREAAGKVLDLILVKPRKIVMLDQSRKGPHYLVWEADKRGREKEREVKTLREVSA
ncbi:MAG: pyridoxamine 5'-phosphate oxidase family protein [Deltaproteobacteria bacterium]|nr:pyridoxamine 5'-phosphate oxidase family protein [Deltaproteobacteria bacterium]